MHLSNQIGVSKWQRYFTVALSCYLLLQCVFASIEKQILWGEFFVLILFFFSQHVVYKSDLQKRAVLYCYAWIFLMPLYGLLISITYWKDEVVYSYLLRNFSMFYYALFFFGGYQFGPDIILLLSKYKKIFFGFFIFINFFAWKRVDYGINAAIFFGVFWMVLQKSYPTPRAFWFGFFALLFFYINGTGGGTAKIVLSMFVGLPLFITFLRLWSGYQPPILPKIIFRIFLLCALIGVAWFFHGMIEEINALTSAGNDVGAYASDDTFSFTDLNGVWRLALWSHILDRFWQYPWGIGLGTPIFNQAFVQSINLPPDPESQYVMGAHNFLITILSRLGIIFLPFLFLVSRDILKIISVYLEKVQFKPFRNERSRLAYTSIITFFTAIITASFNCVIESPLYAAFFWFSFGLFVRFCGDYMAPEEGRCNGR